MSLTPAIEVDQGINGSGTYLIGEPIWNADKIAHENGGLGAETAVRIGIRITSVDDQGQPDGHSSTFFIYEPNCNAHIDGSEGYVETPSITGAPALIGENFLIRQTASTWTESNPVEHGVVVKDLGDFLGDTKLITLKGGEMVRMDIYIWLEGQDVDCVNSISASRFAVNIELASGDE